MKHLAAFLLSSLFFIACNQKETAKSITNVVDYNKYLQADATKSYKNALTEKDFWSARIDTDTTGIGDLGPLAAAYTRLFETGGNIKNLKSAEQLYKKAIRIAAPTLKDSYIRALAHNYISQHRFKEANTLLEQSYAGPSNKQATKLMLFDTYMEIGAYTKAKEILQNIENPNDYNYLIRISKWSDYKGNLDAAISYMEKAMAIAESRNSTPLKIWTYSNIADYYGHDGNIKASYSHYLKTLALQPDNAYAKKGIAWILYSHEKNTDEANRILDSLQKNHNIPDYYLLKSEIASYSGNDEESKKYLDQFLEMSNNPLYGAMYTTYKIEALVDTNPTKALALAQQEIQNRATPETYQLLALAQLKNGNKKEALQTIENFVAGKTSEPMALLHSALVFKANGLDKKVASIKEELEGASFEIGPELIKKVKEL